MVNDTWYYVEATTSKGAHCLPCADVIDRAFSSEGNMVALYLLIGAILIVLIAFVCALKMPPHMHAYQMAYRRQIDRWHDLQGVARVDWFAPGPSGLPR